MPLLCSESVTLKRKAKQTNGWLPPLVTLPAGAARPFREGVAEEFSAGRLRHSEAAPPSGWQPAYEEGAGEAAAVVAAVAAAVIVSAHNRLLLHHNLILLLFLSLLFFSPSLQDFVSVSHTGLRYQSLHSVSGQSNKTIKTLNAFMLSCSKGTKIKMMVIS